MGANSAQWRPFRRAIPWAIALCALAFVMRSIPIRDRCWDPAAPGSTQVSISRASKGCLLHLRTGDVQIDADACSRLDCEPGLASTLERTRPLELVALFGVYTIGYLAWALRWKLLLGFAGVELRISKVWRIVTEAQAGGVLLPGGLGGDALRTAAVLGLPPLAGQPRASTAIVIASVLLDRALGLSVLAGVAVILALASGGVGAGPLMAVLATIPAGFVVALAVLRHPAWLRLKGLSSGRLDQWVRPVLAYMSHRNALRTIAVAAGTSLVVAGVQFAVVRGLVSALGGAPTAEKWVYVGAAMAFIVSAVPALPGGWGTADAAYVFFFRFAGLKPSLALAVCLLYRLFWYVLGALGAILHVARVGAPPGEKTPNPNHLT